MNNTDIFDYLNKSVRKYTLIPENDSHKFIKNKFNEFFKNNNLDLQNDTIFIRSNSFNTYLKFIDKTCILIWDENYWDLMNVLLTLYWDIFDNIMSIDKITDQICGVMFHYLSVKYCHFPIVSKMLHTCGEILGVTDKFIQDKLNIYNNYFSINTCKEFACFHESYHVVNSLKDTNYMNMSRDIINIIRSNLDIIIKHIDGDYEINKDYFYQQSTDENSDMMDELIADFHTAINLSYWLCKQNNTSSYSKMGVVYYTTHRFITFNTLISDINSVWDSFLPYFRSSTSIPCRSLNISLEYENIFGIVRHWMYEAALNYSVNECAQQTKSFESYKLYKEYRLKNDDIHDKVRHNIVSKYKEYFVNMNFIENFIDLMTLIRSNCASTFLSDSNPTVIIKWIF